MACSYLSLTSVFWGLVKQKVDAAVAVTPWIPSIEFSASFLSFALGDLVPSCVGYGASRTISFVFFFSATMVILTPSSFLVFRFAIFLLFFCLVLRSGADEEIPCGLFCFSFAFSKCQLLTRSLSILSLFFPLCLLQKGYSAIESSMVTGSRKERWMRMGGVRLAVPDRCVCWFCV